MFCALLSCLFGFVRLELKSIFLYRARYYPLLIQVSEFVLLIRNSKYIDIHEVEEHISFRNDTGAREELVSPYNFLPFYLPRAYREIERIIYLDSDIVVKVSISGCH